MRLAGPPDAFDRIFGADERRERLRAIAGGPLGKNSGRSHATLLAAQPMLEEALDGEVGEDILTRAARPRCRKARDT